MPESLIEQLPPPLPADRIIALNRPKADLHTTRTYEWNGWTFEVPPGVFLPGATSRMIHDRILDGDIDVRGRRYAAMGVGLGIEAVVAGLRGARAIYAADVHPGSVSAAQRNYARLVDGDTGTVFTPVVGDLFDGFPDGARLDLVTFNPPAVSRRVSEDPAVVRNVCAGTPLLVDFFAQLTARELLAPDAAVYVVVSNTADLHAIVGHAADSGFAAEIHHCHDWSDGVLTYIFRFRMRRGGAV